MKPNDCPVAAAPLTTVFTRTLHRACEIVGGIGPLARKLGVGEETLVRWLDGEEDPPTRYFLAAVDVVVSKDGPLGSE